MSQYISFFAKLENNKIYVPIGSYSRNHPVYKSFDNVSPYGKIAKLTNEEIAGCLNDAIEFYNKCKDEVANIEKIIEQITQCNNPLNEKIEAIEEQYSIIAELNEEIKDYMYAQNFCEFLTGILDEGDTCIYCGVEVSDPNKEE